MGTMVWVTMLSKNICQLDCIFGQGLMKENFYTGRGKSILQGEFIGSRWITQILRHSNKVGEFTAGT